MTIRTNDDFPFMSDKQVSAYWNAHAKGAAQLNEEDKRALRMGEAQEDMLYLEPLTASLLNGDKLPDEILCKLEELYDLIDASSSQSILQSTKNESIELNRG